MTNTRIITDESFRELLPHGTLEFPFQYYYENMKDFENESIDWHWHNEFEFVTVSDGAIRCSIGNVEFPLEEGDGIFINSGIFHRFQAPDKGVIPNILFASEFIAPEESILYQKYISPLLTSGVSHVIFRSDISWHQDVLTYLERIYQLCHKRPELWELDTHTLACRIWAELFRHKEAFISLKKIGVTPLSQARLKRMTDFIKQHFQSKLTLQDIADSAGISKTEALRCFKYGIHTAPVEYLNQYRLRIARTLLLSTDRSISDIAESTGFESISYFDRMFKKTYGITPKTQRKKRAEDDIFM